jgi:rhamnosyltransferase
MKDVDIVVSNTAILVTLYNPDVKFFAANLSSYIDQVSLVIICDNSDCNDKAEEIGVLASRYRNVSLLNLGGNKGIAVAQNIGARYAIQRGWSYLIEMDQDSELPSNYVKKIASSYCQLVDAGIQVGGIGPLAVKAGDEFIYHKRKPDIGLVSVEKTLSSGFFYSTDAYKKIGPKYEELFIDYVDWEWCWRARSLGFAIYIDTNLKISHMLGEGHRRFLLWKVGMPAPIRHYYQYRNSLHLLRFSHIPLRWRLSRIIVNLVKFPIYALFSKQGMLRTKYILKGVIDFSSGNLGKCGK